MVDCHSAGLFNKFSSIFLKLYVDGRKYIILLVCGKMSKLGNFHRWWSGSKNRKKKNITFTNTALISFNRMGNIKLRVRSGGNSQKKIQFNCKFDKFQILCLLRSSQRRQSIRQCVRGMRGERRMRYTEGKGDWDYTKVMPFDWWQFFCKCLWLSNCPHCCCSPPPSSYLELKLKQIASNGMPSSEHRHESQLPQEDCRLEMALVYGLALENDWVNKLWGILIPLCH